MLNIWEYALKSSNEFSGANQSKLFCVLKGLTKTVFKISDEDCYTRPLAELSICSIRNTFPLASVITLQLIYFPFESCKNKINNGTAARLKREFPQDVEKNHMRTNVFNIDFPRYLFWLISFKLTYMCGFRHLLKRVLRIELFCSFVFFYYLILPLL